MAIDKTAGSNGACGSFPWRALGIPSDLKGGLDEPINSNWERVSGTPGWSLDVGARGNISVLKGNVGWNVVVTRNADGEIDPALGGGPFISEVEAFEWLVYSWIEGKRIRNNIA